MSGTYRTARIGIIRGAAKGPAKEHIARYRSGMEPLNHTDGFSCGNRHGCGDADEKSDGCGGELHDCEGVTDWCCWCCLL